MTESAPFNKRAPSDDGDQGYYDSKEGLTETGTIAGRVTAPGQNTAQQVFGESWA